MCSLRFYVLALWLSLMISESQVVVDLLLGQSKNTDQESSWNYFKLVGEFKTYSYITIKLTLANSAAVILTARKETLPQMINRQLQADWIDYEGWYMNSTNHNLIIQIDAEFPDIYLGVYSIQTIDSSYLISFAALNSVPCYNDCLTNGRCSTGNCICSSGYIGKDCGQESKSLHIDQESNFQVEALDGHYANLRMSAKDDKLKMTITSQSFVYIYSKPGSSKHKSLLPNQIEYTNVNAGTSLSFTISQDGFTDWYFEIYNPSHSVSEITWMVKVIISEDSSEYLLYILISISAAILLGWIFFAIYKTRALRSQNLVIPDAAINLDFINQNFPKLAYKARKGGDESVECSICLESFRKADMIRQLSCTHIFHAKCIELWFQRNTVCCLCKRDYKDITTEAEESRVEDTRSANATSWIIEDLDNPTINSSHEETTFRNQNFDFNN